MSLFLGVDPGESGSIACIDETARILFVMRNREGLATLWECLEQVRDEVKLAAVEEVSAMPRQGVTSTFKFGRSYGQLEALVAAARIPYELVRPIRWQTALRCRSKGDKNVTKAAAKRLWPRFRIVHANADALLIAEWARRTWASRKEGASA